MAKAHGILAVLSLLSLVVVAMVSSIFTRRIQWRQELTLYFDTPDGPLTAKQVTEHSFKDSPKILGALQMPSTSFKGEGLPIQLGQRTLFVSVAGAHNLLHFAARGANLSTGNHVQKMTAHGKPGPLKLRQLPDLITFDDLADPFSLRAVDAEDLASVFGPGYALRKAELGVTKNRVTFGALAQTLPWLLEHENLDRYLNQGGMAYPERRTIRGLMHNSP